MQAIPSRARRLLPVLLLAALFALLAWPVLDPGLQLFDRDTGRCEYAFKRFVAGQLRAGALPLWAPFTESGTSVLGQITPALFHPLTLLYALLPFGLAFKLNHLCALPLAAWGAFLLARRLSASRWSAAAAGALYGASGWVVSNAASNVHFALGAAAVPLALAGLHAFLERPSALRLLWGAGGTALAMLAGDPQSLLFIALFACAGGAVQIARGADLGERLRRLRRTTLLGVAYGAFAFALSGPALLPALLQVQRSRRAAAPSDWELRSFSVPPLRLFGLALPWAFDEQFEALRPDEGRTPYSDYLADPPYTFTPFATSITLGLPALLFALASVRRRRGALLCAGAAVCALAALGPALPIEAALRAVVPGYGLFRYAEKMMAPVALLLSLAAALGLDAALGNRALSPATDGAEKDGRLLLFASAAAALLLLASAAALTLLAGPARAFLVAHGREHSRGAAALFVQSLRASLVVEGVLAALLALLAQLHRSGRDVPARALAACTCALAAGLGAGGLLFTAPVELLEGPFPLAESMVARAGPSANRWRIDADPDASVSQGDLDWRTGLARWMAQSLVTQFNAQAGIESVAVYSSVEDRDYLAAWQRAPRAMSSLFGVRFSLRSDFNLARAEALALGYSRLPPGIWMREETPQPRAFLVSCAGVVADEAEALRRLASPAFDPHRVALLPGGEPLPCNDAGSAAGEPPPPVIVARPAPGRMELRAAPSRASLLVVAEHFDPGWSAALDGAPAQVLQADRVALAVRVPAGSHRVELRFWPRGLSAGLALAAAAALLLALSAARERRLERSARDAS